MENQTYSWRWQLAQLLELRWWQNYLRKRNWAKYIEAKRYYWHKVLIDLDLTPKDNERVLEAGCGPAGIFTILQKQQVDAIDPLLWEYENHLPDFSQDQFPYVHFQTMMMEQLDKKEIYDLVFSLNAINHVADLQVAMQHLVQSLKPSGTMVISIDVHRHRFLKFIFRLIPGDILHPQQDSMADYVFLLENNGLYIEKIQVLKSGWIFDYIAIKAKKRMALAPERGDEPFQYNSVKR